MYFSFLAVSITALAACFLRFFQLIRFTDSKTGFVIGNELITYILYGVLILSVVFAVIYSLIARNKIRKISFIGNKGIYISLIALCIAYFFDMQMRERRLSMACDKIIRYLSRIDMHSVRDGCRAARGSAEAGWAWI